MTATTGVYRHILLGPLQRLPVPEPSHNHSNAHPMGSLAQDPVKLAILLSQFGAGFCLVDANEVFTATNPAAETTFGVPPGGLLGRSLLEFLPADQKELIRQKNAERKEGLGDSYELRIQLLSGEERFLWVTAIPDRGGEGNFNGSAAFFQDITQRKHAEQALQRSEARFRSLVDQAPVAVSMTRNGQFLHVNRTWLTLFGFAEFGELESRSILQCVHPEELGIFQMHQQQVRQGETPGKTFIFRALRADGGCFLTATEACYLELDDGPAMLRFFRDITEARRVEAERENLIHDLQKALDEVRELSGLLPICSYCRKVRDDSGYWNRIEAYVEARTRAAFSHGVCPDCMQTYFPEIPQS
jgi:PAS domain S-box-containing protein